MPGLVLGITPKELEEELRHCFVSDLYAKDCPLTCYGCKFIMYRTFQIYAGEPSRFRWYCRALNNKVLGYSDFDEANCILKDNACPLKKFEKSSNSAAGKYDNKLKEEIDLCR